MCIFWVQWVNNSLIIPASLQMCNWKYIYDRQVSIEIKLRYILVYHKCLSVHSAVTLTTFQRQSSYEITYKDVSPS